MTDNNFILTSDGAIYGPDTIPGLTAFHKVRTTVVQVVKDNKSDFTESMRKLCFGFSHPVTGRPAFLLCRADATLTFADKELLVGALNAQLDPLP